MATLDSQRIFAFPSFPDTMVSAAHSSPRPASLATRAEGAPPAAIRPTDLVAHLCNAFSLAPMYFGNLRTDTDVLRFELALGVTMGGAFHARLRQSDWFALRQMCSQTTPENRTSVGYWYSNVDELAAEYGFYVHPPLQIAHTQPQQIFISFSSGNEVVACQARTPCLVTLFDAKPLEYAAYDSRLVIYYEQELPVLRQQIAEPPPGWRSRITRTCSRYVLPFAAEWAINLTLVRDDNDPDDVIYEATIELNIPRDNLPVGPDYQRREAMADYGRRVCDLLLRHMHQVRGRRREIGEAGLIDVFADCPQADNTTTRSLHSILSRAVGDHGVSNRAFTGTIARNLTREQWRAMQARRSDLLFSEKSASIRIVLVFNEELGVHAIDQNGVCYSLSPWPEWTRVLANASWMCLRGSTVFDGELTTNLSVVKKDNFVYIAAQVLMWDGQPYGSAAVQQGDKLRELARQARDAGRSVDRPFAIRARRHVHRLNLPYLLERTRSLSTGGRVMDYDREVVVPIEGLQIIDGARVYEWKIQSGVTVIFFGEPANGVVRLWTATDEAKMMQIAQMKLEPHQLAALSRVNVDSEIQSRHIPRRPLARPMFECRYCADSDKWILVRIRTDRGQPDHTHRVLDTMKALVRPVKISEILVVANADSPPPQ